MKFKLLLFLILTSSCCFADNVVRYRVDGKLTGTLKGKYAYLQVFSTSQQKPLLIQTTIVNGNFVFTGMAKSGENDICRARLFISDKPGFLYKDIVALLKEEDYDYRNLVLEKQVQVTIDHSVKESIVVDGELNDINNLFEAVTVRRSIGEERLRKWYDAEIKKAGNGIDEKQKLTADYFEGLRKLQQECDERFLILIRQYPASKQSQMMLGMMCMSNKARGGIFQQQLKEIWDILPASYKESTHGKANWKLMEQAKVSRKLESGIAIPDYTFRYDNGDSLSINSYRGKFFLLDFWTSWCTPCRAEHYYIKKAYAKFNSKNFTVLQISLDENKDKWLKALKQEELPWTNLRDIKGWNKEVEKLFDLKGVPTSYLIGPDGKIIARDLRGDALEKKLAELLE